MRKVALLATVVWFVFIHKVYSADPVDIYGGGSRSRAMGALGVAAAEGAEAAAYNPAGIVILDKGQISINYIYASYNLKVGEVKHDIPNSSLLNFGISTNLSRLPILSKGIGKYIAIGIVGYAPSTKLFEDISNVDPTAPHFILFKGLNRLSLYPGIGLKLGKLPIALGGGLITSGPFPIWLNLDLTRRGALALFRGEFSTRYAPIIGILVTPPSKRVDMRMGISYRGETFLDVPIELEFALGGDRLFKIKEVFYDFYTPPVINVGLLVGNIMKVMNISLEMSYFFLSSFEYPVIIPDLSGTSEEVREAVEETLGVELPKMNNIFVPKAGLEVKPSETITFRLGFHLWDAGKSLVPKRQKETLFLDSRRSVVSGGASIKFKDPLELLREPLRFDISGQLHIMEESNVSSEKRSVSFEGMIWSASAGLGISF